MQKMACAPTDGKGLLMYFMERLTPEELLEAVTVARMLWTRRNDFVFNRSFTPPLQIMDAAKSSIAGFSKAVSSDSSSPNARPMHNMVWIKPPIGCWKINWDAAIAKELKKMGIGVVIRDAAGSIVAVKSKVIPYVVEPTLAEMVASWYALELGRQLAGSLDYFGGRFNGGGFGFGCF